MDRLLKLAALCSLALTLEVFAPTPALGQNKFLVNSTGYGSDIKRNGVCETAPGNRVCTLRAALQEANFGLGTDGISFKIPTTDPGYNPQTGAWTIRLDQLLFPEITDGVNISGPGASKLILDGISYERIFNITTNANVTISSADDRQRQSARRRPWCRNSIHGRGKAGDQ
jgi:hypothetical protein